MIVYWHVIPSASLFMLLLILIKKKKTLRNSLSLSSDLSCAQNKMEFGELQGPRVRGGGGEVQGRTCVDASREHCKLKHVKYISTP